MSEASLYSLSKMQRRPLLKSRVTSLGKSLRAIVKNCFAYPNFWVYISITDFCIWLCFLLTFGLMLFTPCNTFSLSCIVSAVNILGLILLALRNSSILILFKSSSFLSGDCRSILPTTLFSLFCFYKKASLSVTKSVMSFSSFSFLAFISSILSWSR